MKHKTDSYLDVEDSLEDILELVENSRKMYLNYADRREEKARIEQVAKFIQRFRENTASILKYTQEIEKDIATGIFDSHAHELLGNVLHARFEHACDILRHYSLRDTFYTRRTIEVIPDEELKALVRQAYSYYDSPKAEKTSLWKSFLNCLDDAF